MQALTYERVSEFMQLSKATSAPGEHRDTGSDPRARALEGLAVQDRE